MEEVSLVNYTVKSFQVSCKRCSHVLPRGWTSALLYSLTNCILCLEEDSPLVLFPGVNEMREVWLWAPPGCWAAFGDLISQLWLCFWRRPLKFCTHPGEFFSPFYSNSSSGSSCFCICIPNKQEIVFICMQMCLSPRLRFWIKSFTIPLIPNYTQALTWASPTDRRGGGWGWGWVSVSLSKRISVSLACLVLPSAMQSEILDLIWSTDLEIDRLHRATISS